MKETCAGCGIQALTEKGGHPMVGIMRADDAQGLGIESRPEDRSEQGFIAVPVCEACWRSPEHRINPLKCHFHYRQNAGPARAAAGKQSISTGG